LEDQVGAGTIKQLGLGVIVVLLRRGVSFYKYLNFFKRFNEGLILEFHTLGGLVRFLPFPFEI
jgi:hypothetical protein